MPQNTIGTPDARTTAAQVLTSIRAMVPDPVPDPADDGSFSLATLLQWMNDAMRIMATSAPIVSDWGAFPSITGMDVYNIPTSTLSVEQLWYDLWPCYRSPEYSALFVNKITARSYFFGPHSTHAQPRLHLWPACDRPGATATLTADITEDALVIPTTSHGFTQFKQYGFLAIENELVLYRTIDGTASTITNILRGQGGTIATVHTAGAPIYECNVFYKCSRLPSPLTGPDDPIEIPAGLTPIIELYVLSKCRDAEQEFQVAQSLRKEFAAAIKDLEARAPVPGLRQGMQIRTSLAAPLLFGGRVYVP